MEYNLKRSRTQTFYVLLLAAGIWHTFFEGKRLIWPYITWDTIPRMDLEWYGYLTAIGNFFIFIGSIAQGHLVDAYGTRVLALVATVSAVLHSLAISQSRTFLTLAAAAPLATFANFPLVAEVYAASITNEKERTLKLTRFAIPNGIAMIVGPLLISQLSWWLDLRQLLVGAAFLLLLTLAPLLYFALPETTIHHYSNGTAHNKVDDLKKRTLRINLSFADYRLMFANTRFLRTLALKLLILLPYQAYEEFSRQILLGRFIVRPHELSYIFLIIGVTIILTNAALMQCLQKRLSPRYLVIAASAMLAASYAAQSQMTSIEYFMAVSPLHVIGLTIALAETSTQVTTAVEPHLVGRAVGVSGSVAILANIVQPTLLGWAMQKYGFGILCWIGTGCSTLAALLVYAFGGYMNARTEVLPIFLQGH